MNSASPKVSTKDAMTLLSLRSAPTSPSRLQTGDQRWNASPLGLTIARFEGRDFEYIMRLPQRTVTVGRSSSRGQVDINMEPSSFVSRCHFQVFCLPNDHSRFFITCSGKNGIFVDGVFQRKGAEPMELPSNCALRFPSTTIKINFQSLCHSENGSRHPDVVPKPSATAEHQPTPPMLSRSLSLSSVPTPVAASNPLVLGTSQSHPGNLLKSKRFLPSLNINVPRLVGFASPCPSPTGTISAANSCPTSPRSGGGRLSINFDLPEQEETPLSAPAGEDASAANFEPQSVEPSGVGDSRSSAKPLFSYAQLIVQAINSQADRQLTLSGIYAYISKHYPYYKLTDKGWQNSIRHNLSLNRFFVKVPRSQEEPGKGSFWRIEPSSETKLVEQAFKKRRQRVGNSFASPNLDVISSSAPVSPNHLDESSTADGSSLHSLDDQSRQQTIFTKPQIQHLITTQASKMHPSGISLPQKLLHFPKEGTQKDGTPNVKPELQMPPASIIHDQLKSMTTSSSGLSTGDLQNAQNVIVSSSNNNNIPLGFPINSHGDSHAFLLINQSQNNMVSPKVHSEGSILPITVIQTLSQQQQQQQAQPQQSNSPQMLSQSLPNHQVQQNSSQQQPMSAILLQKLLQQGAMVLGKVSGDAQQQQHPGVYSLTPGGLQLFLGASIGNQQQSQQQQQQFILIPPGVVTPKIEPDDKMKETKPQLLMALPQHQQLLHNLQQHQHFLNFQQQQHENGLSYQVKNEKLEGFQSQQSTSFLSSTSVSSQQILTEKALNGPSKASAETGRPCEVPSDPQSSESPELLGKKRKQDKVMDDSSGKKLKN